MVRDWSILFARGGGPLPTLLVGTQPYGLLPVGLVLGYENGPRGEVEHVEQVLAPCGANGGSTRTPSLACDAGRIGRRGRRDRDRGGADGAGVADPRGRPAPPHRSASRRSTRRGRPTGPSGAPADVARARHRRGAQERRQGDQWNAYDDAPAWRNYETCIAALDAATTSLDQERALATLTSILDTNAEAPGNDPGVRDYYAKWRDFSQESLVDFVHQHSLRTESVLPILDDYAPTLTGMMGELDEPSAFFNTHPPDSAADWRFPSSRPAAPRPTSPSCARWLDGAGGDRRRPLGPAHDYARHARCCASSLRWSIEQRRPTPATRPCRRRRPRTSLAESSARPPTRRGARAAPARGARRPRYRLDAWYTAVAAWRLENKRQARAATGIQVGAYGCSTTSSRASGGAVAGLRARAVAHARDDRGDPAQRLGGVRRRAARAPGSPSTSRRTGSGGRAGSSTASARARTSAGCSAPASSAACTTRAGSRRSDRRAAQLALDAVGSTAAADGDRRRPAARPRGWSPGRDRRRARRLHAREARRRCSRAQTATATGSTPCSTRCAADLDAVADAAVAQSVFSLVQGNVPEATATLTAAATGEVTFPELRFADTPRPAQTVTQRLLLLLDPGQGERLARGRARAAARWRRPPSTAWLAGLLGAPGDYRFSVRFDDAATGATLGGPVDGDARRPRPVGARPRLPRPARRADRPRPARRATRGVGRRPPAEGPSRRGRRRPDHRRRRSARSTTSRSSAGRCGGSSRRRATSTARPRDARRDRRAGGPRRGRARGPRHEGARRARRRPRSAPRGAPRPPAVRRRRGDVRAAMLSLGGFVLQRRRRRAPSTSTPSSPRGVRSSRRSPPVAAFDALVDAEEEAGRRSTSSAAARRSPAGSSCSSAQSLPLAPRFAPADGAALDATFARPRLASPGGRHRLARRRRTRRPGRAAAARRDRPRPRRRATPCASASRSASSPTTRSEGWVAVQPPDARRARPPVPARDRDAPAGLRRRRGRRPRARHLDGGDPGREADGRARRALRLPRRRARRRRSCSAAPTPEGGFSFELVRDPSTRRSTSRAGADRRAPDARGARPVPARRLSARRHDPCGGRMTWQRLECHDRRRRPLEGQEARIADPLWLLGKQWQVGELTGEDAASPILVEAGFEHAPITRVRPGPPDGPATHARADRGASARDGGRARAGARRPRRRADRRRGRAPAPRALLGAARAQAAWSPALRTRFPLVAAPGRRPRSGRPRPARAARPPRARRPTRCYDALTAHGPGRLPGCPATVARPVRRRGRRLGALVRDLVSEPPAGPRSWNPSGWSTASRSPPASASRARSSSTPTEYTGGQLDWYSFDVASAGAARWARAASSSSTRCAWCRRRRGLRARPRRAGGRSRTATSGSATSPLRPRISRASRSRLRRRPSATTGSASRAGLPAGVIVRGRQVRVARHVRPRPTTSARAPSWTGSARTWRFFELTGDRPPPTSSRIDAQAIELDPESRSRCPWLFLPPALAGRTESRPIEQVALQRDEVGEPGLGGGAADRERRRSGDRPGRPRSSGDAGRSGADGRHVAVSPCSTPVPAHQVPLVPVQTDGGLYLRRGPAGDVSDGGGVGTTGALGEILEPDGALAIHDEEIPATGARSPGLGRWPAPATAARPLGRTPQERRPAQTLAGLVFDEVARPG